MRATGLRQHQQQPSSAPLVNAMSLIVRPSGALSLVMESIEQPIQRASMVIALIVIVVTMRGGVSLLRDLHRLLSYFLKKTYVDKEIQIEEYFPVLPEQIFLNKRSDVYHILGCHHIGYRAEPRSACILCKNYF